MDKYFTCWSAQQPKDITCWGTEEPNDIDPALERDESDGRWY
jgi:hypothetical protein